MRKAPVPQKSRIFVLHSSTFSLDTYEYSIYLFGQYLPLSVG